MSTTTQCTPPFQNINFGDFPQTLYSCSFLFLEFTMIISTFKYQFNLLLSPYEQLLPFVQYTQALGLQQFTEQYMILILLIYQVVFTYLPVHCQSCQTKEKLHERRISSDFLMFVVQAKNNTGNLEGSLLNMHNLTEGTTLTRPLVGDSNTFLVSHIYFLTPLKFLRTDAQLLRVVFYCWKNKFPSIKLENIKYQLFVLTVICLYYYQANNSRELFLQGCLKRKYQRLLISLCTGQETNCIPITK